jgi:plastocyanin
VSASWKRSRGRLVILAAALVALAAAAVPLAVAGGTRSRSTCAGATVKVSDHTKFVINQYVQYAMRFTPGTVTVKSGCTLTFAFATPKQDEPHSLSIVKQSDLPKTAAQMESCKSCGQIRAKLVKHPSQPPGPNNPVVHWTVNVGKPGLDAPGDSIVIFEAKGAPPSRRSVTIPVSASRGKILYFMCGLHPWMQGKIVLT